MTSLISNKKSAKKITLSKRKTAKKMNKNGIKNYSKTKRNITTKNKKDGGSGKRICFSFLTVNPIDLNKLKYSLKKRFSIFKRNITGFIPNNPINTEDMFNTIIKNKDKKYIRLSYFFKGKNDKNPDYTKWKYSVDDFNIDWGFFSPIKDNGFEFKNIILENNIKYKYEKKSYIRIVLTQSYDDDDKKVIVKINHNELINEIVIVDYKLFDE